MARRSAITNAVCSRKGFTLPEALIAAVILSAAVIGIAGTLGAVFDQTVGQGENSKALSLGRELMEEIASKPFTAPAGTTDQPGYSGGVTNRALYDTIGDYSGYTDTTTALKNYDGTTVNVGTGYTRTVAIASGNQLPAGHTASSANFALVTIIVQTPHKAKVQMTQLLTKALVLR
jgi:Tfp pilus assembly protein PilV